MATTKPAALKSLRDHPSFLLSQLGFRSDERFAKRLEPIGISARQFGVLRALAATDGQSQRQLSATLRIHRNVMVGMIDELERRGFVERRRHPDDRRAHAVHLTAEARELLPRVETVLDACDQDLLGALDQRDREKLATLLQRAIDSAGLAPDVHPGYNAIEPIT
ncbi:MarR family winged helix-turn-helix transcriptional regulator [Agromyces laixinhei]|uniref:MarR family winged helix-turn-helix transcriptional regulator n=1 Tax=Agromyces laixinhei TaxID=2585717 RepID=UPI0012EE42F0|nr:MarR family transcriptional regulator [Agromyces laixinhei]